MKSIKEEIISISKRISIDLIGFTLANDFESIRPVIEKRGDKGYLSGFEEKNLELRLKPIEVFPKAKSIISIGLSYNYNADEPNRKGLYGKVSKSSWGKDYHRVVYKKMEELMDIVRKEIITIDYLAFVDTGPLFDRAIAHRAGLGNYGKNGFIINKDFGSWIFLGHILIDKLIGEDALLEEDICKDCDLCIRACPTKALEEPYMLNPTRCISYLTQKKEIISPWEERAMGKNIYGCDICQSVCPLNKGVKYTNNKDFKPEEDLAFPKLGQVLKMSNKDFKEGFNTTSSGWRGKKTLQRNAIIALGNSGDEKAIEILKDGLKDSRWEIRFYIIRALGKLGVPASEIIKDWRETETDPNVLEEINRILSNKICNFL